MEYITDKLMQKYLEEYKSAYLKLADAHLKDDAEMLVRYPLLSGQTIGYVSTTFGAGFEYTGVKSNEPVQIVRKTPRVEHLLFDTAKLTTAFFGHGTTISGRPEFFDDSELYFPTSSILGITTCLNSCPFWLENERSSLQIIETTNVVRGRPNRFVRYAEIYGDRRAEFWTVEKAKQRVQGDLLMALADIKDATSRQLELPNYINSFKSRRVVIFGDYGVDGMTRIDAIKSELTSLGYLPFIVLDLEQTQDLMCGLHSLIRIAGELSRFVVFDNSSKSGHIAEMGFGALSTWTTVVLQHSHGNPSIMTNEFFQNSTVAHRWEYDDENLSETISDAVKWAETIVAKRKDEANRYPWRKEMPDDQLESKYPFPLRGS